MDNQNNLPLTRLNHHKNTRLFRHRHQRATDFLIVEAAEKLFALDEKILSSEDRTFPPSDLPSFYDARRADGAFDSDITGISYSYARELRDAAHETLNLVTKYSLKAFFANKTSAAEELYSERISIDSEENQDGR